MNQLLLDPTKTTMLRLQFLRAMTKRFTLLQNAVVQLIVTDDALGAKPSGSQLLDTSLRVNAQQYKFMTDPQKLEAFQGWLQKQVDDKILAPVGGTSGKPWTAQYIESAHLKGITNAYIAAKTGSVLKGGAFAKGSTAEFLRNAFSQPEQLSKLALLSSRTFESLKGVTADMSAKMSNILAAGLANGYNPNKIAKELSEQVGLSLNRAKTIARTEIIHAHAEGQLDGFELLGVDEVGILAEWSTAGDGAVCPLCKPKEGTVYTIAEARGLIPLHPNCVAPWTAVRASGLLSGLRVLYSGEIIEARTANGSLFAVTPNHIMLSEFGFIQAKFLYNGLHLVKTPTAIDGVHTGESTPNKYDRKTSIADVYASLLEAAGGRFAAVPTAPEDLHNEGKSCQSEIHIVRANSILRHTSDKSVLSGVNEFPFIRTKSGNSERALSAYGAQAEFIKRIAFACDSSMGGCRDGLAFFLGSLLEADRIGLAAGTWLDTNIKQSAIYHTTCYASAFTNALNTHPILKQLQHHFHWDFNAGTCVAIERHDPGFFKFIADSIALDAELLPQFGAGNTNGVLLDEIVDIQIKHYNDLYVYDLTTEATVYALDGLIASNCRCSWKPALAGKGKKQPTQLPTAAATAADAAYQKKIAGELRGDKAAADMAAAKASKAAAAKADADAKAAAEKAAFDKFTADATAALKQKIADAKAKEVEDRAAALQKIADEKSNKIKAGMHASLLEKKLNDPKALVEFDLDKVPPKWMPTLNGIPWSPPKKDYWLQHVEKDFKEPPIVLPKGITGVSCGVWIEEPDGRVWLYEPRNHFGGYKNSLPKGGIEPGLTMQQTALKEAQEEIGLRVELTGFLCDVKGDTTINRFYTAKRIGGDPFDAGKDETQKVKLATYEDAAKLFNKTRDKDVLKAAIAAKQAPASATPLAVNPKLAGLPNISDLVTVKSLPGSTAPVLMRDKTDGEQWVVKAGLDAGHARSEALADNLYRIAGLAAPTSGIVEGAGGPVKVAKFIDNGETLAKWKLGKTDSEVKAMYAQISKGFVADAWLANHDVAGLNYDNIFIADGKPIRIDNGGALQYRAQGGAKANFGAQVLELKSMRDINTNPVTASIFSGLTDDQIHDQITALVDKRAKLLAAVADPGLRGILNARLDYLQGLLPATTGTTPGAAISGKRAAAYGPTAANIERVRQAGINGICFASDHGDVEDNNVLIWQEQDAAGSDQTKVQFKLTATGSDMLVARLQDVLAKAGPVQGAKGTGVTNGTHPEDNYWDKIQAALKTVNVHAADGKYNQTTLTTLKGAMLNMENSPHVPDALKQYYTSVNKAITEAVASKAPVAKFQQWTIPPTKDTPTTPPPTSTGMTAKKVPFAMALKETKAGRAREVSGSNRFTGEMYEIDMGDGIIAKFVPWGGSTDSKNLLAFQGMVHVTIPEGASAGTLTKANGLLQGLGITAQPPTPAYEEMTYIHRGVYMRGDAVPGNAIPGTKVANAKIAYAKIWNSIDPPEVKVPLMKQWVKDNYGITLPDKPTTDYNPAGYTKTADGQGMRYWDRWDIPREQMAKDMKGYCLSHSSSLGTSELVKGIIGSGGEFTCTTERVRKGVNVSGTGGMSSSTDVQTGGASYFFTRITKDTGGVSAGVIFKPELLSRQDAISYSNDKFGRISAMDERYSQPADYKAQCMRSGNETIYKNSLTLLDDVLYLKCASSAERDATIKVLKDAGIAQMNDGRKVEDVVVWKR